MRRREFALGRVVKFVAVVLLPLTLAGCLGGDNDGTALLQNASSAPQVFPQNYRTEIPAFMRTYLNNPVGVRDASMADPVQRPVSGQVRYISCLRFTPKESDGSYRDMRESAVLYVNGRLDRIIDKAGDLCTGAVYASFPELEKMTR